MNQRTRWMDRLDPSSRSDEARQPARPQWPAVLHVDLGVSFESTLRSLVRPPRFDLLHPTHGRTIRQPSPVFQERLGSPLCEPPRLKCEAYSRTSRRADASRAGQRYRPPQEVFDRQAHESAAGRIGRPVAPGYPSIPPAALCRKAVRSSPSRCRRRAPRRWSLVFGGQPSHSNRNR